MKRKDDHDGQSGKELGEGSHIRTAENS